MKILRRLASGLCLFSSLTMIATLIYIIINQAKDIDKKFDDLNTLQETTIGLLQCLSICYHAYRSYSSQKGDNSCCLSDGSDCVLKSVCKTDAVLLQNLEIRAMRFNVYYEIGFLGVIGLLIGMFFCYRFVKRREQEEMMRAAAENFQERLDSILWRMDNPNERLILGSRQQLAPSEIAANSREPCSICLEQFQQKKVITLVCNHTFHSRCIGSWVEINARCPVCRRLQ